MVLGAIRKRSTCQRVAQLKTIWVFLQEVVQLCLAEYVLEMPVHVQNPNLGRCVARVLEDTPENLQNRGDTTASADHTDLTDRMLLAVDGRSCRSKPSEVPDGAFEVDDIALLELGEAERHPSSERVFVAWIVDPILSHVDEPLIDVPR